MKMVSRIIGKGYVKVTFYSNAEWEERLAVDKMLGTNTLAESTIEDIKDIREGMRAWDNYNQRFYSETSPHTFIMEE
jgi:hypothetical protein